VPDRFRPSGRATEVPLRHRSRSVSVGWMRDRGWGRRSRRRVLAVVSIVMLLAASSAASAGDIAVVRRGACTGASHWRLRVIPDAGVLRVRLTVRGGRAGQRWNIFMDHDGTGFFAGYRISGEDGLWLVRKRVQNHPGADLIRFGSHNVVTGETCSGRASV
jgi:hypothetical protein